MIGVSRNGYNYYYMRNAQGDVIALYNCYGDINSRYVYDSWGKLLSVTNASGTPITDQTQIAHVNPIRYRGYYYDKETGLYYLQSRYYDSEVGRFINADTITDGGAGVLGNNLFIYCANNPVTSSDPSGHWIVKNAIKWVVKNVVRPVVRSTKKATASFGNSTRTVGINGSAAFGGDVSGSLGITTDNKGNIGVIITGCTGGGTPIASASVYQTVTTAPDIYKQRGMSTQIGGSADVCGVSVGAEYSFFKDSETNKIYHSGTVLVGIGVPIPAELHGEIGYSYVYGFNLYDAIEDIYIIIMEW